MKVHRDISYYQDLTRENRITKGSNDIRMTHRLRLNEDSSISTSDHDEYFSCTEEYIRDVLFNSFH